MVISCLCIGGTLLFVLAIAIWGIYHDLQQVKITFMQSEMGRLRSHAVRTVGLIQDELRQAADPSDLGILSKTTFLQRHWSRSIALDESRLYAAVATPAGKIVAHSTSSQVGEILEATWYTRQASEVGDDIVETQSPALAKGARSLDVRVPIYVNDQIVGAYHSGLNQDWLDNAYSEKEARVKGMWGWVLAAISIAVASAGVLLFYISRRAAILAESVKLSRARRFAEIGQLMTGIVHEIRNPLNAMRLNLHVLSRTREREQASSERTENEHGFNDFQLIDETNFEIERVEGLLRILLGYARPDIPRNESLDVRSEIQATLAFLKPLLERSEILVKARFPDSPTFILMDRDRFRQVLLNLLGNAREAMDNGGTVELNISRHEGRVEIAVSDEGAGVPWADRERIFEPFYSTKETGTGLGLAIVRRYVEDVGGEVICQAGETKGATFVVRLPQTFPQPASTDAKIFPSV